jgi:capsular polysaccharide transport system permease protein
MFKQKLLRLSDVYLAVVLRDMATRFGASYLSYLIAIAWPLTHSLIIFSVNSLLRRFSPLGNDAGAFAFTGLFPFIVCLYPARMIGLCLTQNANLLKVPIVMPLHLLFVRAFLEILNCFVMLIVYLAIFSAFDFDFDPFDFYEMLSAIVAAVLLGVGIGFFAAVGNAVVGRFFYLGISFIIVGLYISSGAFIEVTRFGNEVLEILSWNPLFQCVEWMRVAYYGIDSRFLSRGYVLFVAGVAIVLGLYGERMFRGLLR